MQTLEISDVAYERLVSLRNGRESLSTTLLRELPEVENWDAKKINAATKNAIKSTKKRHPHSEVFKSV